MEWPVFYIILFQTFAILSNPFDDLHIHIDLADRPSSELIKEKLQACIEAVIAFVCTDYFVKDINIRTLHQHPSIASQHPNITSTLECCINTRMLPQHQNIA